MRILIFFTCLLLFVISFTEVSSAHSPEKMAQSTLSQKNLQKDINDLVGKLAYAKQQGLEDEANTTAAKLNQKVRQLEEAESPD